MRNHVARNLATFAFLFFAAVETIPAQTVEGRINGTVTDAEGKVVPGAQVILKNLGAEVERRSTTSEAGAFVMLSLPPGRYSLTVTSQGFQQYVVSEFRLQVNESRTMDVQLSVGAVTQTIEVQASAATINTTDATIGTVVNHQTIVEMPLNGRNFTQLIQLTPGAAPIQTGQQNNFTNTGGISPAINGMRPQMNNFTLDGIENNMRFTNTYANSPPPDAIEEFVVATHQTSPDAALAAGANVNLVSRSGTTGLHGSLWEFLRNDKLTARNFFDNYLGSPYLPFKQNQFGFFLGGPVMIPKLMDGRKSRTFFSTYYEGMKLRKSITTLGTVPDQAQRNGDFSALLGAVVGTDCRGRSVRAGQIYNPFTSVADSGCVGGVIRDPYPNNVIPSSQISPVAQAYLKYLYPLPNRTGTPNLVLGQAQKQDAAQWGIRGDHYFSDNQRIFGRVSHYENTQFTPAALPGDSLQRLNSGTNIVGHYNKVFDPTFLLDFVVGYNRAGIPFNNTPLGKEFEQAVGDKFFLALPARTIPIGQSLGGSRFTSGTWVSYELANPDYTYQYNTDLKKVKGKHEMSFGFRFTRYRHIADIQGAGSLTYSPQSTGIPQFTSTGESMASFYTGVPTRSNFAFLPRFDDYGNIYTAYWGDTWKASPKLTVSYGVQYVYASPPRVQDDKISVFDFQKAKTQPTATDFTFAFLWCAKNPITGAEANCPVQTLVHPDKNNWAPRFGIAYAPRKNTVIRMGFGIFYDYNTNIEQNSIRISQGVWPFSNSQLISGQNLTTLGPYNPPLSLNNPFPKPPAGPPTPQFTINLFNRDPYAMEWNGGIEQMLPKDFKLSLDYIGSGAHKLVIVTEENVARVGPGAIDPRRPIPTLGSVNSRENTGNSSYHSLQGKLEKNLATGLTFLNSFTWSKSLDIGSDANGGSISYTYNKRLAHGPSDYNIPFISVTSFVYFLPVGKGKTVGSSMPTALNLLLGGWETSGIISLRSGQPFSILTGIDNANIGSSSGLQLADVVADPHSGFTQSRTQWFNTAAFKTPAFGNLGTSSRNMLQAPGVKNVDFSAAKNFAIRERLQLQFRAELFNIFNHTNFQVPVNNLTNPNFGQILAAYNPRDIQFGLKLHW